MTPTVTGFYCLSLLCDENEAHKEPVQRRNPGEDEDQNHPDKQPWLLGCSSYATLTNNPNSKAGRQATQTDRESSTKETVGSKKQQQSMLY